MASLAPSNVSQFPVNPQQVRVQGRGRAAPVVGYQVGVPQAYYGQTALSDNDNATLSAMPSVFNRPTLYASAGGAMNLHGLYYSQGRSLIGAQSQAGDVAQYNPQLVGGSSNGMQSGAGLQVVSDDTSTTPVSGMTYPSPPIMKKSAAKKYGNVSSPGSPNIGRSGGPLAATAGILDQIGSNSNWILIAVGSAVIYVLVSRYLK